MKHSIEEVYRYWFEIRSFIRWMIILSDKNNWFQVQ